MEVMLTSNGYVLDESPQRLGHLEPTPDRELTDRDRLWHRMRRQGYLYLPRFLDVDEVTAFRRYYFGSLASTGLVRRGTDPVDGVVGHDCDLPELRRMLFH